jgi:hypothetical protein
MNGWIAGLVFVVLIVLAAWLNHDANDGDVYCEMVALWRADAAQGVPHADRHGWPPYRGASGGCAE